MGNIKLTDNDILGVQHFQINDPGPDGQITWAGTASRIFVSPLNNANTDGMLRIQNDGGGISLEDTVRTSKDMSVGGKLAVGASSGSSALFVQDNSAVETGMIMRNYRPGTNSRPFVRLEGITPNDQGAWGEMRLRTGAEAGGSNARNEGGLEMRVSTGGAGSPRSAMMIEHSGDVGFGTTSPLGKVEVSGVDVRSKPFTVSGSVPGIYLHDTERDGNGAIRYASFVIEADGSRMYLGSRAKGVSSSAGSGSRAVTLHENGKFGLGTSSPKEKLDVRGNAYIDGDLIVTGQILDADGQPINTGGGGATLPTGGLAAYLSFDEGAGNVIRDQSGNNNNFSFANGATWTPDGLRRSAVKFDGNNDYIYRNNTGWSGYFTISLWIKTSRGSGYWTSESNPGPGGCIRHHGGFNSNKAYFWFWDNSNRPAARSMTGTSVITDNNWHHIAVTLNKDQDKLRLFVDGVEEASTTTQGNESAYSRLWVGGINGGCAGNHTINGSIDEYRLYHRALGSDEIRNLYEAGASKDALYVRPDGNVGIGTQTPEATLDVNGDIKADSIEVDTVKADSVNARKVAVGEVAEASAGRVLARRLKRESERLQTFTLNDHHWSLSNGFFVEAHSRYYDSGYVKFYIDTGYRSYTVRKLETHGDVGGRFGLRIIQGDTVGNRGGHPERRYHVYAQASYYTQWNVVVKSGSMRMITGRNANSDGELYVLSSSGHRNVDRLSNSSYESNVRGDLRYQETSPLET